MSEVVQIQARNLLKFSPEVIRDNLAGEYEVVFDDGVVTTNAADLIISRCTWNVHEHFDKAPLNSSMRIAAIKPTGYFSVGDFTELANRCFWPAFDAYKPEDIRDELCRLTYEGINELYNLLVSWSMPYMRGLDITDFVAVTNHPEIRKATEGADESPESIAAIYDKAEKLILTDSDFDENRQAVALRSGLINTTQALQTTVIRGYLQDISTRVFNKPVMRPYVAGIRSVYESMIESRGAAISLINSQSPLQNSEYFSRRLQHLNKNLRNLHPGDCGTTRTLLFPVKGDVKDASGVVVEKGNLSTLEGCYYLDEKDQLQQVKKGDKHLEGKYIRLRTPVAGCAHPDIYGICSTCFGGLADTIPVKSSISHITAAELMRIFTQGILSLKHRNSSAVADEISFEDQTAKYLKVKKADLGVYFTKEISDAKAIFKVRLSSDAVPGLIELQDVDDYERIGIARISAFQAIELVKEVIDDKGNALTEVMILPIASGKRKASLSIEALEYIKQRNLTVNDQDILEIDLSDWTLGHPFIKLPAMQYSTNDHRDDMSKLIEGEAKESKRRSRLIDSPEKLFLELCDLVNSRLNVNVSILGAIFYAGMVVDTPGGDFSLPKAWTGAQAGVLNITINGRSMGGALCYEEHSKMMNSLDNFIHDNRLDHPMDVYFCPEALEFERSIDPYPYKL